MIREVTMRGWQTSDGCQFSDVKKAVEHEVKSRLDNFVDLFFYNNIDRDVLVNELWARRKELLEAIAPALTDYRDAKLKGG